MRYMFERWHTLRQRMAEEQLDALYIQNDLNRRYMSGFTGSAGSVFITRQHVWLLVDFRYVEQAKKEAPHCERIEITNEWDTLAHILKEHNLQRVGFEAGHVTVAAYETMKTKLPDVTWVATLDWVEQIRGIKDDNELQTMQQAIDLTDEAFRHIVSFLTPGRTEKEIALELEMFMRRQGAEALSFPPIVASGPNGALPHAVPTDRPLEKGDLVTLDFGCIVDGYCSDLTRTVAIGEASEQAKTLYDIVLRAQLAGIQAVEPGRTGKEVDKTARAVIEDAGYGQHFGHGLGHGIGLNVHEQYPRLSPMQGDVVLQAGMVCSVEPGIYIPDWGGIRIEDLVVVRSVGCDVLSKADKQFLIV